MSRIEYETLSGDVTWIGDKSFKFFSYDKDDEVFIPHSCVPIGEEPSHKQDDIEIRVASWFCKKEGLI